MIVGLKLSLSPALVTIHRWICALLCRGPDPGDMKAELAHAQRYLTKQVEIHGFWNEAQHYVMFLSFVLVFFLNNSTVQARIVIDNSIYKTDFFHHCSLATVPFHPRILAHCLISNREGLGTRRQIMRLATIDPHSQNV